MCWIIHLLSSLPQITDLGAKTTAWFAVKWGKCISRESHSTGLRSVCTSSWQADELQSALLLWLGHAVVITGDLFWRNPQTGLLTAKKETRFSLLDWLMLQSLWDLHRRLKKIQRFCRQCMTEKKKISTQVLHEGQHVLLCVTVENTVMRNLMSCCQDDYSSDKLGTFKQNIMSHVI